MSTVIGGAFVGRGRCRVALVALTLYLWGFVYTRRGTGDAGARLVVPAFMGTSQSSPTVHDDLTLISHPAISSHDPHRRAAFDRLRKELLRELTGKEKMEAIARVNARRFTPWPVITEPTAVEKNPPPAAAAAVHKDPHAEYDAPVHTPPPQPSKPDAEAAKRTRIAVVDGIRGCLYGGAIADAVGLMTEFLSKKDVRAHYGDVLSGAVSGGGGRIAPAGAEAESVLMKLLDVPHPDSHRVMWLRGDWTDDTDQQVLLLASLCENRGRVDPVHFAGLLGAWVEHGFPELGDESAAGLGQSTKRVVRHDAFLTDPARAARAVWEASGRALAANGAVMRTCVTGIPEYTSREAVVANTLAACGVTHADPRCRASCVAVALVVAGLLELRGGGGSRRGSSSSSSSDHAPPSDSAPVTPPAAFADARRVLDIIDTAAGEAVRLLETAGAEAAARDGTGTEPPDPPGPAPPPTEAAAAQHLREFQWYIDAVRSMSCVVLAAGEPRASAGDGRDVPEGAATTPAELRAKCRAKADAVLESFALDEPRSIGYTLKCMACGLWALVDVVNTTVLTAAALGHAAAAQPRAPSAYAETLLRIIVEGGDADTNGAVAGGLMGAYLGWSGIGCARVVAAMPHAAWLEAWVQKLLVMMGLVGRAVVRDRDEAQGEALVLQTD